MAQNFGPPLLDFAALGNIGKSFFGAYDQAQKQQTLAELGRDFQAGNFGAAAGKAAVLGDLSASAQLAALNQKTTDSANDARVLQSILGGGGLSAASPATPGEGDYFSRTRSAESSGNDAARNPASTATGRYQFLEGTWNGLMKSNPELGLTPDGRTDPQQQERAMRAFTAQNAEALKAKGIAPTDANLYVTHFLGAGAAPNFISAVQQDPSVPATSLVSPQAAAANRAVFYNRDGTPKTAGDVYAQMAGRFGNGSTAVAGAQAAPVQMAQAPAEAGDPRADLPAAGASEAQGFVIPGSGQVVDQQTLASNPRVQNMVRALGLVKSDQARSAINKQLEIELADIKARQAATAPTDVQRNYELARRQGYQGSFLDYQRELRAQTNVNVPGPEKSYDTTVGKAYGEQFVGLQKDAQNAAKSIGTINMMERLMQTPGFYSGFGGERALAVNRALTGLGLKDPKVTSAAEAFQALSNQTVLDAAGGSLGAQISNGDRDYISATAPNLANTPEGNKELLGMRRKLAERQQVIAKMARDYAKGHNGRIDAGFDELVADYAEKNPLFPRREEQQPPARPATSAGQPQPQSAPAGAPTATGPNGQRMIWNGQAWVPLT